MAINLVDAVYAECVETIIEGPGLISLLQAIENPDDRPDFKKEFALFPML